MRRRCVKGVVVSVCAALPFIAQATLPQRKPLSAERALLRVGKEMMKRAIPGNEEKKFSVPGFGSFHARRIDPPAVARGETTPPFHVLVWRPGREQKMRWVLVAGRLDQAPDLMGVDFGSVAEVSHRAHLTCDTWQLERTIAGITHTWRPGRGDARALMTEWTDAERGRIRFSHVNERVILGASQRAPDSSSASARQAMVNRGWARAEPVTTTGPTVLSPKLNREEFAAWAARAGTQTTGKLGEFRQALRAAEHAASSARAKAYRERFGARQGVQSRSTDLSRKELLALARRQGPAKRSRAAAPTQKSVGRSAPKPSATATEPAPVSATHEQ